MSIKLGEGRGGNDTFPSPELSRFVAGKLAEASTPNSSGNKFTKSVSRYFDTLMDAIIYSSNNNEALGEREKKADGFSPAEQLACLYVFVEAHEHEKKKG